MKSRTVLFIDDDPDDHFIISEEAAERKDLECLFYFSAKTAFDHLKTSLIKPTLIVLDLNMPIMNGLQFLEQIKQSSYLKHIPVVVHSTGSDERTRQQCMDLGAAAYMKKDLNCRLLFETITLLLQL